MARTKYTSKVTKKPVAKAKTKAEVVEDEDIVEDEIEEEIDEVEEEEEVEVAKPRVKKTFDQSDGIACRSIVYGSLFMEGLKTQMIYSWTDYDDVTEVEYRDLVAAVRSKSKFVYNPWFIIEDEDFLEEYPQIKKFYTDSYSIRDLKKILTLPVDQMIDSIKKLPSGAFENMKSIAAKQVSDGILDSVSKIKALDQLFDTDLNLIGQLVSDNN